MVSLKYKLLNQTNPEYNELETKKLQILYCGGNEIKNNASLFIPKEIMENSNSYQSRLNCSVYKNYFAEIVNSYCSEIFSKTISVIPAHDADDPTTQGDNIEKEDDFYHQFADNADLKGHDLSLILKDVLTEATVTGKAYIAVDFPNMDLEPSTLLEEEQMGTSRAYILSVPTLSIIDWELDEDEDEFRFVVIKNEIIKRNSIIDQRDMKTISFKVWTKENNIVRWQRYELTIKANKCPKPDDDCILMEEGISSFKKIPILKLNIPKNLWIGNMIGNLCADHFKRYSTLVHAENRNLFSIPVYRQGPELSTSGDYSEISQNPNRGMQAAQQMRTKGFAVVGEKDEIYFAEPDGKAYEIVSTQLKELVDEIHKVTHTMASSITNTQKSSTTSGLSKLMDNRAKEIVLTAYGDIIKNYVVELYGLISDARNENIIWTALGLDDYKLSLDRDQLLKEATSISLINIPSKTFKKAQLTQIATQYLDSLSPQEQLIIKQEISDAVDNFEDDDIYNIGIEEDEKEEEEEDEEDSSEDKKAK